MAKTIKIEGSMKDPGRPMTKAEFDKMREKAAQKKKRTVKRRTTSK